MCVFGYKCMSHALVVTYIFSFGVKPVSNVASSGENDWVTQRAIVILRDKKSQIEHFVEEADPAVCTGAVKCHFFWGVEATELIWPWNDLSFLKF